MRLLRQRVHVINEIHVEEGKNRDLTPRYRFLSLDRGVPRKFRDRVFSAKRGAIQPQLITSKTVIGPLKAWVNVATCRDGFENFATQWRIRQNWIFSDILRVDGENLLAFSLLDENREGSVTLCRTRATFTCIFLIDIVGKKSENAERNFLPFPRGRNEVRNEFPARWIINLSPRKERGGANSFRSPRLKRSIVLSQVFYPENLRWTRLLED